MIDYLYYVIVAIVAYCAGYMRRDAEFKTIKELMIAREPKTTRDCTIIKALEYK